MMFPKINYNTFTLPNGLRCVHRPTDSPVNYIGLVINVGSRDDGAATEGLAHFVEHTIFKGTEHRSSWHISNRLESIGGVLNAYTAKEETAVYTIAPSGSAARAMELLADIIGYSTFPLAEIDKERDVVKEEISSYRDSPSDSVYDTFEEMIYAGSGLAHNILGTPESVDSLTAADCRAFIERFYVPSNMVLYIAGPEPLARMERLANRHFGFLSHPQPVFDRRIPPMNTPFSEIREEDGHQAHTIYGARIFNRFDSRRHAMALFSNWLGGPSMNSRLNQELRERRGLVYTVDCAYSFMSDNGLWCCYFGSDRSQVDKCLRIIRRELDNAAQSQMKPGTFERMKKQYVGQMLINSDRPGSTARTLGKMLLYYGEVFDMQHEANRILEVTPEQMRSVAELLADSNCSSLTFC